jgi:hypothetical protein
MPAVAELERVLGPAPFDQFAGFAEVAHRHEAPHRRHLLEVVGRGGDVVAHSRGVALPGSLPAISPPFQLRTTLIRNRRIENAIRNEEKVMIRLVAAHAGLE